MAIKESILPEFEHEMATTRLLLERIPAEHAVGKPHPKSMSLGELASHLADVPSWVPPTFGADSFEPVPLKGEPYRTPRFSSREGTVRRFDRNVAPAPEAVSGTDDAHLMVPWSVKRGSRPGSRCRR